MRSIVTDRRRGRLPALIFLVLVVVAGAVTVRRLLLAAAPPIDLTLEGRLALLPFVDATGEPGGTWVETGLMEMVAETLARTASESMVSPDRLRKTLAPRGLGRGDPRARERAHALALASGADLVLDAVVRRSDQGYAIDFEILDAARSVAGGRLVGVDPLVAGAALAFALGRGLGSDTEPFPMERLFSRTPFLDRLYAMGLQQMLAPPAAGPAGTAAETTATAAAAAVPYFEIALEQQPGFLRARARLADCYRLLGEHARGRKLAREVLEESQTLGQRRLQAWSLRALGRFAALAGERDEALDLYSRTYSLHLKNGDRAAQAEVLFEQARLALAADDDTRAEELYVERVLIQQTLGDRLGEADTLLQIGSLLLGRGELAGAEQTLTDARELALQLNDAWTEVRAAASLGEVARRRGDSAAAASLWRQALTFHDRDRTRRLLVTYRLAEVLVIDGELDEAEEQLHEVARLAAELGESGFEAKAAVGLAWLQLRAGYPYQARSHLDRALELDRHLDDRFLLQVVIAWYAYEQGNYRLAVESQAAIKRQSANRWRSGDEKFLQVYERAHAAGRRLPLPGEEGYNGEDIEPETDGLGRL